MNYDEGKFAPLIWIGGFKLAKAALLGAVAFGVHHLVAVGIEPTILHWAHAVRVDPEDRFVRTLLERLTGLSDRQIRLFQVGTLLYGLLYATEGVGLLLRLRWAEYLTVVSTALLLPVEVYEVIERATWPRTIVLAVNVVVVAYLVARLRREIPVPKETLGAGRPSNVPSP